mmetsp:Transcript_39235/g.125959  ORF Transcript_39235/g.125959 Transcript_39235/m.125959 type:complete len:396 (-) Transcript_39235:105-1292(-)
MVKAGRVIAAILGMSAQAGALESEDSGHGYKSSVQWLPRDPVPGAISAETLISEDALPEQFDWRNVNGNNFVAADWNQHIPVYCGACWIHGTTSALNDRIKVMRGGAFPDVMLGRQAIVNCVPDSSNASLPPPGCNGGDAFMIHKYLMDNKVPDETCLPYQARNMGCASDNVCRNCFPGKKGCFPVDKWIGYGVSTYGTVKGEKAMMKEIYARGPIACSFATNGAFMLNYTENVMQHEGVYIDRTNFTVEQIDHVMEVAGWGETPSGQKYWVIRNSWGTFWGNAGWLRLGRGTNMLQSESSCDWAVPSFDDLDEALVGKVMGDYVKGIAEVEIPWSSIPALTVLSSEAPALHTQANMNPQTFLVLFSTFVSGVGATLLALRLSGARSIRRVSLLG